MAAAQQYDQKTLDECGKLYYAYLSRMNTLSDKTWIARQLIQDMADNNFDFMGSYLTYPEREIKTAYIDYPERALRKLSSYDNDFGVKAYSGQELKDYYGNTTDGDLFPIVRQKISDDLTLTINNPNRTYNYICFLIGGIVKKNNVSHHLGFIYKIDENMLRILDPGRQSWGPQTAIEVKNICLQAFRLLGITPRVIETFSRRRGLCGSCAFKQPINPQDITRGTTYEEWTRYNRQLESTNRESFCQTWSILLMLADIQKIKEGTLDFSNPLMDYWDDELIDLEVCIRKFILWIIKRNSVKDVNIFKKPFLDKMEKCFQIYNPLITIPNDDDVICSANLSLHQFGERVRQGQAAVAAAASSSAASSRVPSAASVAAAARAAARAEAAERAASAERAANAARAAAAAASRAARAASRSVRPRSQSPSRAPVASSVRSRSKTGRP